jgi:hypothetical protein
VRLKELLPIKLNMIELSPTHRKVSAWGWTLAALSFPAGPFVAFGFSGVLSWLPALLLAACAYGSVIAFIFWMQQLQESIDASLARTITPLIGLLLCCFWAAVIWWLGKRIDYWTANTRRGWKRAAWFAAILLGLSIVSAILQSVVSKTGE